MSNSKLVTYTKISPNRTSPRKSKIDTITIHCTAGNGTAKQILNLSHFVNYNPVGGSSCNYAIGYDGSIGLCVEEKDRSWCSSNRANDHRAITIEVSSDYRHPYTVTDAAYNALIDLLVDICERYPDIGTLRWKGDKKLIGKVDQQNMTVHRWFAAKACPGDYLYNKHSAIAREVNKRLGVAEPEVDEYTLKEFIMDVQSAIGAKVDGIAGPETFSKTVTLSDYKNDAHAAVKPVQKRLVQLGYTEVGIVDGIAGPKFTAAVKRFQKDNGCIADGEITARGNTWKKLLEPKATATTPTTAPATTPAVNSYTLKEFVMDIQKATGAKVDGIAGPETLSKTVTLSSIKNNRHAAVKAVQKRLAQLGYTEVGSADGIAGAKFNAAVKHFQKDNGCYADGEITAGKTTWKKLLGMP